MEEKMDNDGKVELEEEVDYWICGGGAKRRSAEGMDYW